MESISQKTKYEHIPVFLSSDDRYAPFVTTTIISIMSNTKSFVDFYILDGGISKINQIKIKSINQIFPNFSIEFIKIDTQKEFKGFPTRLHFSIDMYTRYLIPQLKPNLNKVIYSDVDVIFNGDILKLYEENLNGFIIGAVPYTFGYLNPDKYEILSYHKRLKLSNKHEYFESGLLLIDCKKWREEDITFKLLEKTKASKSSVILTPDQDVFNIIFENNYQQLNNKYVVVPNRIKLMMYNEKARASIENPFIYHYAGSDKPWNNPNIIFGDRFWKYAKLTPFYKYLIDNLISYNKIEKETKNKFIIYSIKKFFKKETINSIYRKLPLPIKKYYRFIKSKFNQKY